MYYVYMLRCEDNSIYTGITNDIERRMDEHFNNTNGKAAKYTKAHKPIKLEASFPFETKSEALKEEYRIKHLSKEKKEELIISYTDCFSCKVML